MPTYEFICLECGHSFSQHLSISRRKEAVCVKCGSSQLEQVFRCCNVLGGKGTSQATSAGNGHSCSHPGGCGGCSGCS